MTFELMVQLIGFGLFLGGSAKIGWEGVGVICWLLTKLTFTAIDRWRWRNWEGDE
jgi:hypothetical protein